MTIEKAIEIVSDSANRGVTTFNEDYKDAQRLLIEAGKRILAWRKKYDDDLMWDLEGETEED